LRFHNYGEAQPRLTSGGEAARNRLLRQSPTQQVINDEVLLDAPMRLLMIATFQTRIAKKSQF